jgi:uncharacterized protein
VIDPGLAPDRGGRPPPTVVAGSRHLMLVPSLACPAGCSYCFGPHAGTGTMARETLEAVVGWQAGCFGQTPANRLEITFHGGEPLVPGAAWYRTTLPLLRDGLAPRKVRFAIQTNLWLLTDELCELFREHRVAIGTSLDGPEEINDAQRGRGYFARTMAGIERARTHGLDVGCICTFTAQTAPRADEIFDFFLAEGLSFSVHAALPSLRYPDADRWSLPADAHGELLVGLLDRYLSNLASVRISTLDSMARGMSAGRGGICTFGDCLGGYLAVGPDGTIYPCQRFAGMPEFGVGNVHVQPSLAELRASPVWSAFAAREERVKDACGACAYLEFCNGGCPYNAMVGAGGTLAPDARDPHCEAYRRTFDAIGERALAEVFSPANLEAVIERPDETQGLLRRGKLLSLMRDGPHPSEVARQARVVAAAVALAEADEPAEAARRFVHAGLAVTPGRAEAAMTSLHGRLSAPATGLNNCYLHVTFACNLRCSHCYADAGPPRTGTMSVAQLERATREAAQAGFRHVVVTGGEPLVHPRRDAMLDGLAALRAAVKPTLTVLRTSLAVPLDEDLIRRLRVSTDELVVSLDGDRETHDARRGPGTYDLAVANLRAIAALRGTTELSLAAVLPLAQANGAPGASVRALACELGIRRTRFRPLLPLGRAAAANLDTVAETVWGHLDPSRMLAYGFEPTASCGIGQNLYVEPDLRAYPCYAWCGEGRLLGSIDGEGGLAAVLDSAAFGDLACHTVNTNRACRSCSLRYLCGGACRAWAGGAAGPDLDAPPVDCRALHARARSLLVSALEYLEIDQARWLAAGLPLPGSPPNAGTSTQNQGGSPHAPLRTA